MLIPHMHFKCQGTLVRLSQKSWLLCQDPENIKFSTIYTSERKYPLAQNKKKEIYCYYPLLIVDYYYCNFFFNSFCFRQIYCLNKDPFSLPHDTISTSLPLTSRFIAMEKRFSIFPLRIPVHKNLHGLLSKVVLVGSLETLIENKPTN